MRVTLYAVAVWLAMWTVALAGEYHIFEITATVNRTSRDALVNAIGDLKCGASYQVDSDVPGNKFTVHLAADDLTPCTAAVRSLLSARFGRLPSRDASRTKAQSVMRTKADRLQEYEDMCDGTTVVSAARARDACRGVASASIQAARRTPTPTPTPGVGGMGAAKTP